MGTGTFIGFRGRASVCVARLRVFTGRNFFGRRWRSENHLEGLAVVLYSVCINAYPGGISTFSNKVDLNRPLSMWLGSN